MTSFARVGAGQRERARINAQSSANNRSVNPLHCSDRSKAIKTIVECRNAHKEKYEGICNYHVEPDREGFKTCQGCEDSRRGARR